MDGIPIPCPFCGGSASVTEDLGAVKDTQGRRWAFTVVCDSCAASSGLCWSVIQAIDAWNRWTDGIDPTRLAELKEAELEGRVRILPRGHGQTCGACANFICAPREKQGSCAVRKYIMGRCGTLTDRPFRPYRSRKACSADFIPRRKT